MNKAMVSREAVEVALKHGYDDVLWYSWSTDRFCVGCACGEEMALEMRRKWFAPHMESKDMEPREVFKLAKNMYESEIK